MFLIGLILRRNASTIIKVLEIKLSFKFSLQSCEAVLSGFYMIVLLFRNKEVIIYSTVLGY